MNLERINEAAELLTLARRSETRLDGLPAHCRPVGLSEAYAVQARVAQLSGRRVVGWKIAATSVAGQKHIGVDGPIAARLLSEHVIGSGLAISIAANVMNVAEAEFAFRMSRDLPPRAMPYSVDEVMEAVAALPPAIEIPDSRYTDFARAGAAQLVADADRGTGRNVLGDPPVALTWLANELCVHGQYLRADDLVTTGACVAPVTVAPGDAIHADFGVLGAVDVAFV